MIDTGTNNVVNSFMCTDTLLHKYYDKGMEQVGH